MVRKNTVVHAFFSAEERKKVAHVFTILMAVSSRAKLKKTPERKTQKPKKSITKRAELYKASLMLSLFLLSTDLSLTKNNCYALKISRFVYDRHHNFNITQNSVYYH